MRAFRHTCPAALLRAPRQSRQAWRSFSQNRKSNPRVDRHAIQHDRHRIAATIAALPRDACRRFTYSRSMRFGARSKRSRGTAGLLQFSTLLDLWTSSPGTSSKEREIILQTDLCPLPCLFLASMPPCLLSARGATAEARGRGQRSEGRGKKKSTGT